MHIYPIDLIFINNFKECEDVSCCISAIVLGDCFNCISYNLVLCVYIYNIFFIFSVLIAVFVIYMVAYIRIKCSNYWERTNFNILHYILYRHTVYSYS